MGKASLSIVIIILGFTGIVNGQLEKEIGKVSDISIDKWYEISIDNQILQSLAGYSPPKDVGFQFAVPVPVNLTPENSGYVSDRGDEIIWIIGIRSKLARSLNLILEPFHIPPGAYVYLYDKGKEVIRGAFTDENNNPSDVLPTMPVPGEEIILEYHIPKGIKWKGTIGISQVSHDYLGVFGSDDQKDNRYNLSQPCNVDINCPAGSAYQTEKRAVCRLIVRGVELCTGVLINNTSQQNRPLLLTAQHCIADQNDASKSIFVFGYESPWCKGPDGRITHSLSGAILQSTNSNIDFSLVELSSFPPFIYRPYLAGWDVSGIVPQSTVTIHHPEGDVKKISIDNNAPVTSTFTGYTTDGFWKILQWENGTTEGGSSGSPLFDQNKRVVGILTGGEAICGRSVNDYFAKLSVIYDLSSVLYQQLKGWIDPSVTGVKQFNGRDPYEPGWLTVDTLSNISKSEALKTIKYSLPGTGYATGFNSDSLVMYAEHFTNPPGREISEVLINISKASSVLSTDSVRVYIFDEGSVPGQVLASQRIWLNEAEDSFLVKVDFNNTVPVPGNFYAGWRIWYKERAGSETRQFAVFHSPDRLLPALNSAWFNNGTGWKRFTQHPFSPMSVSLDVKVVTTGNSAVDAIGDHGLLERDFIVYPNPARDLIIISSKKDIPETDVTLTDIEGSDLRHEHLINRFPGEVKIDISALKSGFYFLNFTSSGVNESQKIIIIH
jgi:V8-like Glu-specific endopeptidase